MGITKDGRTYTTARTGAAAHIRKLKERFPEMGPTAIAKRVGCTSGTVCTVLKRYSSGITEEELRDFQTNQADIFDLTAHRLLLSMSEEKIANAKAGETMVAAGIAIDKARLIRGQATSINLNVLWEVVEAIREQDERPVLEGKPAIGQDVLGSGDAL